MSCSVKRVPTTSFEMKYMRFGREGAAPIVILPGLSVQYVTDSAEAVAAAYGKLAADYDIYLFDRRTDVPEEYGIRQMAEDTAQAMQILGLHEAGIFGVSQGGMIAQALAARYPQLVNAMVLGSTACRATAQTQDIVCSWIELAKEEKRDELMDAFAKAVYSPAFYDRIRSILPAMAQSIKPEELSRFVILASDLQGFDLSDQIGRIGCPVLVIGAGADRIMGPDSAPELAEKLDCDLYIYEGYGHGVYDEAPDYVDRLKQFFDLYLKP